MLTAKWWFSEEGEKAPFVLKCSMEARALLLEAANARSAFEAVEAGANDDPTMANLLTDFSYYVIIKVSRAEFSYQEFVRVLILLKGSRDVEVDM